MNIGQNQTIKTLAEFPLPTEGLFPKNGDQIQKQ